jgi:urease gamma subunit
MTNWPAPGWIPRAKRLARGLRLNYPEAVALIATQIRKFIRGRSVAELMDLGRQFWGART